MQDFVTVFEISRGSNGVWTNTLVDLAIGGGALIAGLVGLGFRLRAKRASLMGWVMPLLLIAWSVFWLYDLPRTFRHINRLVKAYQTGQHQVVEGEVGVLHEQPATGHTKGDVIAVNGSEFEVNYFLFTPAYRTTIAHKGVLKSGVYARLYHVAGEILRVDIRKP